MNEFIKDKKAAIALGKALFWDMNVGSDNIQSCGSCHFQAGADPRTKNQISPGLLMVDKDGNPTPDTSYQVGSPNYTLKKGDFPFHKLADANDRHSKVISDSNDVVSSQGVTLQQFEGISDPDKMEKTSVTPDDVFNLNGINTRRVEPRNTPTVINAVFNHRNFWDGRAQESFNGVNPFGLRDPSAFVWKAKNGKELTRVAIDLDHSSLASQAVGPVLSSFEMSATDRRFPELGRKLLNRRPLSQQKVHSKDSVLGDYSLFPNKGLKIETYAEMIRNAFRPEWWQGEIKLSCENTEPMNGSADTMGLPGLSKAQKKNKKNPKPRPQLLEFTQMEANFSLYFGLALQAYMSTLVSDETPFDNYAEGKKDALTQQQKQGLDIFFGKGKCINCHGGAEFTNASVDHAGKDFMERMVMADKAKAVYDSGFYNTAVRPTREDLAVGGLDPFGKPLSFSRLEKLFGEKVFRELIGANPNVKVKPDERVAVDGAFKTPGLRNVELTAPYFHNGGTRTLREVVDFYNRGGDFHEQNIADLDPDIECLYLSEYEKEALVAFMKALTDERVRYSKAPFDHPQLFVPNGHLGNDSKVTNDGTGRALDIMMEVPAVGRDGTKPSPNFLDFDFRPQSAAPYDSSFNK